MRKLVKQINNEKGMATFEALPLLVIFVMLISYALGMYGSIHSGTLHSIGARTYAFETFRNRANLNYFKAFNRNQGAPAIYFSNKGYRLHGVGLYIEGSDFTAAQRPIAIGRTPAEELNSQNKDNVTVHNDNIFRIRERNQTQSVAPIWLMVRYGMCLNAQCGGTADQN